jgi:hypothetical protein
MRSSGITIRAWVVLLAQVALPAAIHAQVVDGSRTVTGPGGASVERDVRREYGPGGSTFTRTIRRPGGTFQRQVRVGPVIGGGILGPVVVPRPATAVNFSFGALLGPPIPPPVVLAPVPVAVAPGPVMVVPGPALVPAPGPAVVAAPSVRRDPYADALGRLSSRHAPSRRDGALTLGMIRDPRAVPALADLLQHDWETEVRVASARALGAIGDSKAAGPLEEAAMHDRSREVRQAAAQAFARLPQPSRVAAAPVPAPVTGNIARPPSLSSASPWKREATPPPSPEPAFMPPDAVVPPLSGPVGSP